MHIYLIMILSEIIEIVIRIEEHEIIPKLSCRNILKISKTIHAGLFMVI